MSSPLGQLRRLLGASLRRYLAGFDGSFFIDETALLDPGAQSLRAITGSIEFEDTGPAIRPDGTPRPLHTSSGEPPAQPLDKVDPGFAAGT